MKKFLILGFFFVSALTNALSVEVPEEIEFGGMQLKLTEGLRKILKEDIELITKSPKGFQIKVDRSNLYFPIIERVLKEENLPDDFKFLALQESSLVPDAVSTSKAVGYWQFKKESAVEVGLRVDHEVDERMNIVSSSRGAAKYLKKNNGALNNWVYALLSYNMGLGGVKSRVEDKYIGAKKMVLDKDIHWYVVRFLAHKLAFQDAVGKNFNPSLLLIAFTDCSNKTLKEISQETEVDVQNLELYNKWLLKTRIPEDRVYAVILPVTPVHKQMLLAKNIIKEPGNNNSEIKKDPIDKKKEEEQYAVRIKPEKKDKKNRDVVLSGTGDVAMFTSVNKVRAIKAKEGDTPSKLALIGGISTSDFLRYNEMKSFEAIVPGKVYYLQPKRNKGLVMFYTVGEGESLRDIAHKNGIKATAILTKNRMSKGEALSPGRVLWLRAKRPSDVPVEIKKSEDPIEKDEVSEINSSTTINSNNSSKPDTVKHSTVNQISEDLSFLPSQDVYHEIKPGETLYGISRMYSLSVDTLRLWNNLQANEIKPGNKLVVRKTIHQNNAQQTTEILVEHVVQGGETLYQISKKYNVTVDDIQRWNNKSSAAVSIGEKLIIKKKQ